MSVDTADLTILVTGEVSSISNPKTECTLYKQRKLKPFIGVHQKLRVAFQAYKRQSNVKIPEGWSVKIEPDIIPTIDPGSFKEASLMISVL
ncbi:MAG: hypothetical protein QXM06_00055 [Archaeoglobaceae archaeon]